MDTINPTGGFYVGWQHIQETPAGLVAIFYGATSGGTSGEAKYSLSTDNGVTWSAMADIYSGIGSYGEPTPLYLGDGKLLVIARANTEDDKSSYVACRGTATVNGITWETPLAPHSAGIEAQFGSPVSLIKVGDEVHCAYSSRRYTDPKVYTNRVTASDMWDDPYCIFKQTHLREEIQEKTSLLALTDWGYPQMCECRDANSDANGEDYTSLVAWWEEGSTNKILDIKMQTLGGTKPALADMSIGSYPVTVSGTALDADTGSATGTLEITA
jgi:hypothetical protein